MAGENTYPAIARKAKAHGCEIQWADETGLGVQSGQLRPQLCPQRAHPGHPATGQALFAVDDFQPDQSGQAAFHDL